MKYATMARTLGVAIFAAVSLGACATRDDIRNINTRLDAIDAQVARAAASSESANQNAARANQRLDNIETRVQQLEQQPARRARG